MSSITVVTISSAKYAGGEMVQGPMETAETDPINALADLQTKIEGLNIRRVFYRSNANLAALLAADVSALVLFGKDRDGAFVFVFYNTTADGPGLGQL